MTNKRPVTSREQRPLGFPDFGIAAQASFLLRSRFQSPYPDVAHGGDDTGRLAGRHRKYRQRAWQAQDSKLQCLRIFFDGAVRLALQLLRTIWRSSRARMPGRSLVPSTGTPPSNIKLMFDRLMNGGNPRQDPIDKKTL
jgi:hypothetical protein